MKILHIINSLRLGGAEKLLIYFLMYSEKKEDIDMNLLTLYPYIEIKEFYNLKKIKYKTLGFKRKYDFKILPNLTKELRGNYDLIHVHLFPAQYYVSFSDILNRVKIPMIFTEHSIYNRRRGYKIFKIFDNLIYKYYEKILCVSKETEKELLKWLPNLKDKSEVIYPGVFLNDYSGNFEKSYDLVFIGKFNKTKGFDIFLKTLFMLEEENLNLKVCIVGYGDMENEIKNIKDILGKNITIDFLGKREDVYDILMNSKILVYPSRYEGLPITILESMSVGTPVIATNVGGIPEIIENGENGILINKEDSLSLKNSIIDIINNDDKRKKLSLNAYKTVKNRFSIENYFNNLIDIYKRLIDEKF